MGLAAREIIPTDAQVLALHSYWLTLYPLNVRAIDLAFALSDPAFGLVQFPNLPQTLHTLDPDFIVVSDSLLFSYRNNPAGLPGENAIRQWRELDEFTKTNCSLAASGARDSEYGQMLIYQCGEID